jgi:lipid-binding SYLF domain-containing protein
MKRNDWLKASAAAVCLAAVSCLAAESAKEKRFADDVRIAAEIFKSADWSIKKLFETAAGYALFPNVGKGGLVFGGAHGQGLVYEKGNSIGSASLTQVTFGAQIGGQEFSEVIFFETPEALGRFKDSKLEMSAQLCAVAAAEGAAKNAKYVNGVLIVTKVKSGLMAEASVGGQKFKFKPAPKAK